VTVLVADPTTVDLPPYLASLAIVAELHRMMRRHIGRQTLRLSSFRRVACLPVGGNKLGDQRHDRVRLAGAVWKPAGDAVVLGRRCPKAPTDEEHADASNTRVSKDKRVTPLGLLWFGGPGNDTSC
jgi:hypothetical protein